MNKIAVSGGTGYVGRFVVDRLLANGHAVVILGRKEPAANLFRGPIDFRYCSLSEGKVQAPHFSDCEALVHAAFHHVDGKYRGGEGDDPEGFRRLNHLGSMAIFNAAKTAGVKRVVFVSSRAVYGSQGDGELMSEGTEPNPDTLYGQVKLESERELLKLEDSSFLPIIVRATGIYGASECSVQHKWACLFNALENGESIDARIGTEVHGEDFAQAVDLLMTIERAKFEQMRIFNISDILLDRHELLKTYARLRGLSGVQLPPSTVRTSFNQMDCSRLKNLGWKPRGALDLTMIIDRSSNVAHHRHS